MRKKPIVNLLVYFCFALMLQFTAPKVNQNPFPSQLRASKLNYQSSASFWKTPICVLPSCNPGGTDAPASATQTSGHASPSLSGSSFQLSLTTKPTSTQTNALYVMNGTGGCSTCNWLFIDDNQYVDTTSGTPSSIEVDQAFFHPNFGPGNGTDAMWGFQCNKSNNLWQYANQSSAWSNTAVSCSAYTYNTWHHFQLLTYYINSDTSCSGYPRLYWIYVIFDGVKSYLNVSMCSTQLTAGWAESTISQRQLDIGATSGTAKTVNMYIDNANIYAGSF